MSSVSSTSRSNDQEYLVRLRQKLSDTEQQLIRAEQDLLATRTNRDQAAADAARLHRNLENCRDRLDVLSRNQRWFADNLVEASLELDRTSDAYENLLQRYEAEKAKNAELQEKISRATRKLHDEGRPALFYFNEDQ